jgi:hypothetical protein
LLECPGKRLQPGDVCRESELAIAHRQGRFDIELAEDRMMAGDQGVAVNGRGIIRRSPKPHGKAHGTAQ